MQRTLIVARLDPGDTDEVARLFAKSDATELPHLVGVTRRTLYTFHDLYFHLVEADGDVAGRLRQVRQNPLFTELNEALSAYVRPYDPGWREPKDAMATPFYEWRPQ
jgi:cyclase